jgi:NAD(P)-dependent dehydrogenase (short-subunit alcohol dehydrogenase family)
MKTRIALSTAAAAAAAGYLAWDFYRHRSRIQMPGRVVLITGGSRGLGLQLAREFGKRGAAIGICGRDQSALNRAKADLTDRGIRTCAIVCDVSDRLQVESLIAEIVRQLGPIDVVVNNAGIIRVGPFAQMTLSDFEQAIGTMFWGMLYTTLAVLPSMREQREGRIVNIVSIGGKVSVPHLLPYSCAKFAALALSQGLHSELAPAGINVTTIVPGLMRTGSHLRAEFKGKHSREYSWFSIGAATPLVSIGAKRAARDIVCATIRREGEKILSAPAGLMARLHDVFPEVTGAVLSLVNRLLPSPELGGSNLIKTGAEIQAGWNSTIWNAVSRPGQRAAASLNQVSEPRA